MVWSFILSRTLVPTMAKYLLQPHAPSRAGAAGRPSRNPLVRFQRGFEARFERVRARLSRPAGDGAARTGRLFVIGFLGVRRGFVRCWCRFSAATSFPSVDAGQILMHVRAQVGTRVEESAASSPTSQKAIRQIIPPDELDTLVDNIGMPISGINMTYNNTGTIGPQDGDIQIALKRGPPADRRLRPHAARGAAARVSRHDLLVPAGRHRQPDPEFRRAGADRRADPRRRISSANFAYANKLLSRIRPDPGHCRRAHPAVAQQSRLQCRCRPHARAICRPDRARRHQQPRRQPRRAASQVAPTYLAQSGQRRVLFDRDADAAVPDRFARARCRTCRSPARRHAAPQILGGVADIKRVDHAARSSRSTTSSRWCRSTRRRRAAISARSPPTCRSVIDDTAKDVPKGSSVVLLGQVQTMNSAFSGLLFGLLGAIVLIYLLIVVNFQSWLDPFVIITALPAALAGIVWMLFATADHAVGAGAHRRDHVHGRCDRQQRAGHQLRARAARASSAIRSPPRSKPASCASARC